MTIKNLNEIYWIEKDLATIGQQIRKGCSEERAARLLAEQERLIRTQEECYQFIDGIRDEEVKVIARLRYIDHLSWIQISMRLYSGQCDIYTPRKKLYRYLQKHDVK